MELPEFDFVQPRSLKEVYSTLKKHKGKAILLAGGTTLLIALRYRLTKPAVVVGLKGLTALGGISHKRNGDLVIGSMVPLSTLEKSPSVLNGYAPLAQAIQLVATPSIRNKATIGGNLCLDSRCIYYNQSEFWRSGRKVCFKLGGNICNAIEKGQHCQAVYQGDLGPVLIALGAKVKIASSKGEKTIPLSKFFTEKGEKPNILKSDELLMEVRIPAPKDGVAWAYEKFRVRDGMDFPLAGVAVMVKRNRNGIIEQAKIVLGAVGPSPTEVPKAAELLEGHKLTDGLLQRVSKEVVDRARPVGNLAMNAGYRRKTVGALVKRALRKALSIADR